MHTITTSVEIAAAPEVVRDKFLDFAALPTYSPSGFIQHIIPVNDKLPEHLQAGDQLKYTVNYGKSQFTPTVRANSPDLFSWVGSIPGIFTGEHRFSFECAPTDHPGQASRTRLVHEERFTGLLSFLMGQGMLANAAGWRDNTRQGFESFNRDFKEMGGDLHEITHGNSAGT